VGYLTVLYGYYVNYRGWRRMHGATQGRALAVVVVQTLFWGGSFAPSLVWT
jgi:hypothetical protein